ncbi:MAG TPA: phosphate ABC transporter, permease protein PstA, partial [Clostridia bacterium]|nr:phosphate ABC transporter, permease protein PstA [Clostridia bacterium]
MKEKTPKKRNHKKRDMLSVLLRFAVVFAAALTGAAVLILIGYVFIKGVPNLNLGLFSFTYNSENASLMPALINTLSMTVISLVIAAPIGIFSAIYLVEYAKRGNKLVRAVAVTAE